MNRKVDTINVSGGEYAKVATRLKSFWEDNPYGEIKSTPDFRDDNQVVFETFIKKNKTDIPGIAEANGFAYGKITGPKAFEKLESISLGRALAKAGYAASGEIASFEEMEEFYEFRQDQIDKAVTDLLDCKTLDELKDTFMNLGSLMSEKVIIDTKNAKKEALSEDTTTGTKK